MRILKTLDWRSAARVQASLATLALLLLAGAATAQPGSTLDDLTAGYIYFVPAVVWTTNGCAEFVVNVDATLTNARAFSFQFYVESASLNLIEVVPGGAPGLHLMPELLRGDTLWLDGFFDSQTTGPGVNLAALRMRAVAPDDAVTQIQFIQGRGYGGTPSSVDTILFAGGMCTVNIEGTPPLPPQQVVIQTLPYPTHDDSLLITWRRVTHDVDGGAVTHPLYNIYLMDLKNNIQFVAGSTYDTVFYCNYVSEIFWPGDSGTVNIGMLDVRACKTQP